MPRRFLFLAAPLALAAGCSVLVDPDPELLGNSDVTLADGGVLDVDAGPGADLGAVDLGPRVDAQPGECPAPPACEGTDSLVCESGARVRVPCPEGCDAATGQCVPPSGGFTPSNVGRDQFRPGAPVVDLDGATRYDTGACTSMSGAARPVPMRDGGEACVLSVSSFRLRPDSFLQVFGPRPLIVVAAEEIRIEGLIDVSARGDEPGPSGALGGRPSPDVQDGQGPGGGRAGEHVSDFDDGGGGGGGGCGHGGAGGFGGAAAGGGGGNPWLTGGDLQPLVGGSGGGRGRGAIRTTLVNAGLGGAGGGALQLTAGTRLIVTGGIVAGGGGGGAGLNSGDSGINWGSGGGGGAGGNVILESPEIQVDGGVSVVGGGGGGSASSTGSGESGQDGVDGALERPAGGASGGVRYGAAGGDGAGLASTSGADGAGNDGDFANGGGGGGGGGCVVLRSNGSPAVPTNPGAVVSSLPLLD